VSSCGRDRALTLEIRSASAGTGKTTSLVLTYLEALRGAPARRIAAVTFTRSSAKDLRERLRSGLRQALETGRYLDFVLPNREPFERALRELDSSVISTIHGFFRELLRLNAPALGLEFEFSNLDETDARDQFRAACSSVMASAALAQGVGALVLASWGWERTLEALELLFEKRVYAPFRADEPLSQSLIGAFQAALELYLSRLAGKALSATDVELRTLELLQNPEVLARIRQRFQVLLVDEFQDVNPLQAKVFRSLGVQRMIFVGDAKQSIYAFRDADVNAFLDVYAQAKKLEPLMTSYRHGTQLATFFSGLAEGLFPEFSEVGLPAQVSSGRGDVGATPELHIFETSSLDAGRASEAQFLANRLQALRAQFAWRDMAVLIRTRGSLEPLERAFSSAGIPFLVGSGQRYYDRREIRDALTMLRAKLNPHSKNVLAALARLPGVDVPLQVLERVLAHEGGIAAGLTLPEPSLEPLRGLLTVIDRAGDALDVLESAWLHLGTRLTSAAQSYANLDGLLYQLAARGARDPRAALVFLERARLAEAEGDEPLEGEDAVRIMTVHGSKGLEFAVCAVFDLARGERKSTDPFVVHPDGEVALQGSKRYVSINKHWEARRGGEANRLLYVALTRAKDVLLMTGSRTRQARGWLETMERLGALPTLETFMHEAHDEPALGRVNTQAERMPLEPDESLAKARFPRPAPRVRAPTRAPEAHGLDDPDALPDETSSALPLGDPAGIPNAERVIGTLTHYAIAENFQSDNPVHERILAAQYVLHPYPPLEREEMVARALWYLAQYEALYPVRDDRLEDHAELPFAFKRGQTTWQGIIDRLYQESNGTWVLEDFKTDDVPIDALELRARAYERQMALYFEAIRQARQLEPEVRLTFLRHGVRYRLEKQALENALKSV
jgi:ATP-dependent exoDNAse (exonuclease V) beta subunit